MKTLIIYDSVFGNTEQIALAIANFPEFANNAEAVRVQNVKTEHFNGINLLVVGSPTRQFRATTDISSFISDIPDHSLNDIFVAGFDTRLSLKVIKSKVFRYIVDKGGYAAKIITEKLVIKGGKLLLPPEGFYVCGEEGPLETGECDRAADWAKKLMNQFKADLRL